MIATSSSLSDGSPIWLYHSRLEGCHKTRHPKTRFLDSKISEDEIYDAAEEPGVRALNRIGLDISRHQTITTWTMRCYVGNRLAEDCVAYGESLLRPPAPCIGRRSNLNLGLERRYKARVRWERRKPRCIGWFNLSDVRNFQTPQQQQLLFTCQHPTSVSQ